MASHNMDQNSCDDFAARLETALESAESGNRPALAPDLERHLQSCEGCSAAFEDAALGRSLLQSALEPAVPAYAFSTRVMATIRSEEATVSQGSIFWRPLEHLAAKVALVAVTVVMLLSFYVYGFMPRGGSGSVAQDQNYTLVPQPENQQPATKDDVLLYLAESGHGR
jgi:hypothetical protein